MATATKQQASGVQQSATGKWIWVCGHCGQTSTELDSRDKARESYRIHRREICGNPAAAAEDPQSQEDVIITPEPAATPEPTPEPEQPKAKKGKKAAEPKPTPAPKDGLKTFRIAFLKNTKTGRECALTVQQDGKPQGARYQAQFPVAESWTEIRSESFKTACEAVRAGQGTKVTK